MSRLRTLRLGTRGSDLAMWQARRIAARMADELGASCEITVVKTQGDRIQNVAFHKMEGKGFFTKELQDSLLADRVDLVVHSLKDLPTDEPPGLQVAAIPERGPSSDVLLAAAGSVATTPSDPIGLAEGATVGSSSLRRAAQILALRPDLRITALRGNVPTRVQKLRDGHFDAILLAAAGVSRLQLDLTGLELRELPMDAMLPAPGQGALAIETRADGETARVVSALHDGDVAECVDTERNLLQLLGGGCHLPLGCLAHREADGIRLQAVLGSVDAEVSRAEVARVAATAPDPQTVARACHHALRLAMPEVVDS
jgi:hydroxymethylbilane synthase